MISEVFIKRPRLAGVVSIVLMLAGALAIKTLPIAEYPPVTPPQIVVSATYPGASAEVLANTVAGPIEDAVNGVDDMIYMSSSSDSSGSYSLSISFKVGSDPNMAMVKVQNRVAQAESLLPTEVTQQGVTIRERSSDMLGAVVLRSPKQTKDSLFLSDYAYKVVRPALERVPGVSNAQVYGPKYSMRVWLDSDRLTALGLGSSDVLSAIRSQNIQASVGSVGSVPGGPESSVFYTLKAQGRLNSPGDFENIVLRSGEDGAVVYLKDVARVEKGGDSYLFNAKYNGEKSVVIMLNRATQANALETMDNMRAELEELSRQFPDDVEYVLSYDATKVVRVSIEEIVLTLFLTIFLVVLVCYVFLQDWRATLIPTLTIPVSLLATFAVLKVLGYSINTLTLFGLVLAIGIVVDDAIVVVERVLYLMEHEKLDHKAATIKAMEQVTGPVIATTLVLLAIFVPIGFSGGITGKIYQQFAVAISTAVFFSSVNALSLSPALCATMLQLSKPKRHGPLRWFNTGLERVRGHYVNTAIRLARRLVLTILIMLGVLAGIGFFGKISHSAFLPEEDKGIILAALQLPEGSSLARTEAILDSVLAPVPDEEGIESVLQVTGFSLLGGTGENVAFFLIKLDDWSERKSADLQVGALLAKYQQRVAAIPGAQINLFTPPAISGLGAQGGLDIRLQAVSDSDPQKLNAVLKSFLGALNQAPEIQVAFSTYAADAPHLFLEVDRTKAALLNVEIKDVFATLQNYFGSRYVNDVNFEGQVNKVIVQADWNFRNQIGDVEKLYVKSRTGEMVPLGSVLRIKPSLAPRVVERYNKFSSATINAIAAPSVSSGTAMEAVRRIAGETLPDGYTFDWSALSYQEEKTASSGGSTVLVALALIFGYLFLVAQYESWTIPLPVMVSTSIACLGAMAGLYLMDIPLSIYAQLGLILLVGLACKNAILIVEFSAARRREGLPIIEAAADGAGQRFRAVLMTAFTFILGIFPMMISSGAGSAARRVIGNTVFWGMLAATVFGIVIIPALYVLFQTLREKGHAFRVRNLHLLLVLLLPALLGGCISVGSDYKAPELPDFGAPTNQTVVTLDWWKRFNDPELDRLIGAALENNNDLKSAIASVREARARLGVARGGYGPSVDATGSAQRFKTSDNAGGGTEQNLFNAGFDAVWEIDLFGGTRRTVEAAVADWQARQANLGDVQISVAAETAIAHLELRTYQRLLAVARSSLETQQGTLDLLKSRNAAGLSNELAVQQALYNFESTRASIPPIEAGIEASRNALAVLVGEMPGKLECSENEIIPFAETGLNGIPADVLRRRPDVRRAERQLAAQTARIGQSVADLYPKFSLVGSIGLESFDAPDLLESDSGRYSIAPGVSWPIFHSGSIRSNIKVQEARQEQALATYETTVLNAVREVRNALADCRTELDRRDALARAVGAAQAAEDVARDLYKNGLTDFNNVLDAQRSLYNLQRELAVSEGQISNNTVRLYKALGGGWQPME